MNCDDYEFMKKKNISTLLELKIWWLVNLWIEKKLFDVAILGARDISTGTTCPALADRGGTVCTLSISFTAGLPLPTSTVVVHFFLVGQGRVNLQRQLRQQ